MNFRQRRMAGGFRPEPEFEEKIVQVKRVSTKTRGGNRIGFSVLTVVGDKKGRVGVGLGKAPTVREAIRKGFNRARKHLITVPLRGTTIPHRILVKQGAAQILLKPAPEGTGLRTGGAIRAVVEVAGIRDLVSKILGTRNRASNVYATFTALKRLELVAQAGAVKKEEKKKEKGKKKETKAEKPGQAVSPEKKGLVADLNLSARTKNALIKAGIETRDQLKSMSEGEILAIKGLGKTGLGEIKALTKKE